MYTVLVCEDQREVRYFIKSYFEMKDIKVIEACQGYEALQFMDERIDALLLDIMMPGIDGYEVMKHIRKHYDIPIIMISALSEEENQLKGYELGADDYMTKPFKPSLLYAKTMALLKRNSHTSFHIISFKEITLNTTNHQLMINNQNIDLTNKEYQLLYYLLIKQNILITREQLLDHVWGYDYLGDGRVIDTYIKRVRKKLGQYSHYIQTVKGAGYILKDQ